MNGWAFNHSFETPSRTKKTKQKKTLKEKQFYLICKPQATLMTTSLLILLSTPFSRLA